MATALFYCLVPIYILNWTEHNSFEQERNSKVDWNIFNCGVFFLSRRLFGRLYSAASKMLKLLSCELVWEEEDRELKCLIL